MGGIINGFLAGAGNAAYDIGKMQFADNLQKERDEADFLRTQALQDTRLSHISSENELGREHTTSERQASDASSLGLAIRREEFDAREKEADRKAREKEGLASDRAAMSRVREQEAGALERANIAANSKTEKNPQLIKYTDSKGMEQEGVLQKNKDGSFTIVKPDNGEVMIEEISAEELKNMAAKMNADQGRGDDWVPFNELTYKSDEVRAAVVKEKEGGIVNNAKNNAKKDPKPEAKTDGKTKYSKADEAGINAIIDEHMLQPGEVFEYTLEDGTVKLVEVQ